MKFLTYAYSKHEDKGFEWVEEDFKEWIKWVVGVARINCNTDDILDGTVRRIKSTIMRIGIYDLPDYVRETASELLKSEGLSDDLDDYMIIEMNDETDFDFDGVIMFIPKEWLK